MPIKKICCLGANHVGGLFCSVLALKCPEIEVTVADNNEEKIAQWNSNQLPVFENNLDDLVKDCRGKNLFFTTEVQQAILESDIIFISAGTHFNMHEASQEKITDVKYLQDIALLISETAQTSKIVVEKSTVPLRAAEAITAVLDAHEQPGRKFVVLSNPEFLTQGTAVNDLLFPDRVLIGGDKSSSALEAIEALITVYEHWVPRSNIFTADTWSSELAKIATSAFLAQRISSINSLSEVCESTNADVSEVASAIGMDPRIGAKGLEASIGFGGPSFYTDVLTIIYLCESLNLPQVAAYWQKVLDLNEYQKKNFTKKIMEAFYNSLKDKKLTVLGFSFKKDTGGTIESPAIYVCKKLVEEGAKLNIYDPVVPKSQIISDLMTACQQTEEHLSKSVTIFDEPYAAITGTQGIVICTDWAQFGSLDYYKVYNEMEKPAYIFDGRKMLPHNELMEIGFNVQTIGKNLNPNSASTAEN